MSTPPAVRLRGAPLRLIAATVAFWASLYLYVSILSPYAETVGASMTLVGLIVSSYGFSQLVLRIPVGIWSDRLGRRKPFIVAAFACSAVAGAWLAAASGPWGVLAARTLSGVAATMWVVLSVLFAGYFPPERAGYAMSLLTFSMTAAQLAATLVGGLIAEAWGWRAPFWGAVIVAAVGFALTLRIEEGRAKPVGLSFGELARVGRARSLLLFSLLGALHQFNTWVTLYGFTPNHAVALGASRAALGWLSFASAAPIALASLASGTWVVRFLSERQMVLTGFAVTAAATVAIPLAPSLEALFVSQFLGGFGRGLVFPVLMGLVVKSVPPQKRATAMGFFQSIYALGMFAGPALAGVVAEWWGLTGAFSAAAAVTVAGFWVGYRMLERGGPSAQTLSETKSRPAP